MMSEVANTDKEKDNRRLSARSPLFMLVKAKGHNVKMWAKDIGMGGMLCDSDNPIWPGTYLDLSFSLPDG
ncbi:hypothetical protein KAI87_00475, partial [Myxococcota bacterium]|nr:hypothetical protein [Myxococcota bacterium]